MKIINTPKVMKNASEYDSNPATFSRAVTVKTGKEMMYVSGTASVGVNGEARYKGNFNSQAIRMFLNVTSVLRESGYDWNDVVRTTIYLKNIKRHYKLFNKIRARFFILKGITNYPASTCIQARLCWDSLLCEMEVIAVK